MKPSNPGEKSFLTTKKKGNVIINPKKEDLMKETKLDEKKLDPVGKEDKDIDNDGDHDKSDRYLLNRRKVRSKVIKMREAAYDALRAKRAKKPQGEGGVDTTPDEANVGESVEQIDELSYNTTANYLYHAKFDKGTNPGGRMSTNKKNKVRNKGIQRAEKKLGKDISSTISRHAKHDTKAANDGRASEGKFPRKYDVDSNKYKGPIDVKYSRGFAKSRRMKEEVEQIDELSSATLKSYIKKRREKIQRGKQGLDRAIDQAAEKDVAGRRLKKPKGTYDIKNYKGKKGTVEYQEDVEHITEISADKLTAAAKAAEVKRGKKAVAGDREGAVKAIAQNKKFYDAAKAKRMKESTDRVKARMIQFTKDHDQQMQGKQPI